MRTLILKHHPPSRLEYLTTRHFEIDLTRFGEHGRFAHFTLGVEHRNEMQRHQIVHFLLVRAQPFRTLPGRNDRMVIRHFLIIEHLLRFGQLGTDKRSDGRIIILDTG